MLLQEQLRELFLLEQQVRGLRGRLDAATARTQSQRTRLEQLNRQRNEMGDQLKQAQVKAASFEHQSQDMDEKIARFREQMNSVKNNKEYSALLVEVNTLKIDKTKIEDQALEHMAQVERAAASMAELDKQVEEQAKMVSVAEHEVTAARAEVGEQLDAVTAKRDAAEQQLPDDARLTFKRLANVHEGEALGEVVEESRRHMEYSCGGCFMSIPAERVNALMTRPNQVVTCTNCGRILYLNQALKESLAAK